MSILYCIRSSFARYYIHGPRCFKSYPRPFSTYTEDEEPIECSDPGVEYEVILPPEPYVFGVEHIQRRIVPQHIKRPPYVRVGSHPEHDSAKLGMDDSEKYEGNGRVQLGSMDEEGVRHAGKLAAQVRNLAEQIIRV
jgi:methionyl aminopeptidase